MRWVVIFLFFLLLFILSRFLPEDLNQSHQMYVSSQDVRSQLNLLLKKEFIKRLPKERTVDVRAFPSLEPWHRMTGSVGCDIGTPSIKIKDADEALRVSLPYVQAYFDTVNNVREIRPFLIDFPMSSDSSNFLISFAEDDQAHRPFYFPYITSLMLWANHFQINCFYKDVRLNRNLPDGTPLYSDVFRSIYDMSKGFPDEIKKLDIPHYDTNTQKVPIPIPETKRYSYLNDSGRKEYKFCQKFAKENGLVFIAFEGSFSEVDHIMVCADPAYAAQEKNLSLEEARELALRIQKEHVLFYNNLGRLPIYVHNAREIGKEVLTNPINAQRYLGFRVSFWDAYLDRVSSPAIAEVRVYKTKAQYFVADELQRLKLVHEEEFPSFELDVPLLKEKRE